MCQGRDADLSCVRRVHRILLEMFSVISSFHWLSPHRPPSGVGFFVDGTGFPRVPGHGPVHGFKGPWSLVGSRGMATESGGCRALESGPFSAGSVFPSQVQTQLGQRQRVLVVVCLQGSGPKDRKSSWTASPVGRTLTAELGKLQVEVPVQQATAVQAVTQLGQRRVTPHCAR